MKLYIKNMACIRCKMVVKSELEKLGLHFINVELGETEIVERLTPEQIEGLNNALKNVGLELMDDKKSILVDQIKSIIIELVHYSEEPIKVNLSDYITEKLNYDYTYLANLFSEVKGITIEKFYLTHKIEKVKELLMYEDFNLNEIADKLNYSSVSHLSSQFKKITGLSPTHFKKLKHLKQSSSGGL